MERFIPKKSYISLFFLTAALFVSVIYVHEIVSKVKTAPIPNPSARDAARVRDSLVSARVIRPGSPMVGAASPLVVVTQFSDYACASCAAGWEVAKLIKKHYVGDPRVAVAFRQAPNDSLHRNSSRAAEAAEAAGAQGKFWEMHQLLFDTQDEWRPLTYPVDFFVGLAKRIDVPDLDRFEQEVKGGKYAHFVRADLEDARLLQISGTPVFFVNTARYTGVLDEKTAVKFINGVLGE